MNGIMKDTERNIKSGVEITVVLQVVRVTGGFPQRRKEMWRVKPKSFIRYWPV